MRMLPPGKGRGTSNIYAEPDFYAIDIDIAKNYPLVRSQPMFLPNEENNEASKFKSMKIKLFLMRQNKR